MQPSQGQPTIHMPEQFRATAAAIPTVLAYQTPSLGMYRVYSALYEFGACFGWIAAPPSHVALFLGGISPRAAGAALRRLCELGHIERCGKRHVYRIPAPWWIEWAEREPAA